MIEDGIAEDREVEMFQKETSEIWEYLMKMQDDPYSCSDESCRNTDFSSGVPLSLDTDMGHTKLGKNVENANHDYS